MAREHHYFVYLLSNKTRTVLYIGVTSDLEARLRAHIGRVHPKSFTARYQVDRLMYYEEFEDVLVAIAREKQLKGWTRAKKECAHRYDEPALDGPERRLGIIESRAYSLKGRQRTGREYPAARSFGSLHSPQDDRHVWGHALLFAADN